MDQPQQLAGRTMASAPQGDGTRDIPPAPQAGRQNPSDDPARQAAQEMSDYRQWLQTRQPPSAGHDMEPAPQAVRENPSNYPTRQAAEAPPTYRPWSQVQQMPYQAYRDHSGPPPADPYYPAPRTYYPAPSYRDPRYDDQPARFGDR
jgi:hypothetical protein